MSSLNGRQTLQVCFKLSYHIEAKRKLTTTYQNAFRICHHTAPPWSVRGEFKSKKINLMCFFFSLLFLSRPWLWIAIHCYSHRTDSEPSVTISAHKNTHQHAQTMDSGAFLGDSQGRARPWRIESHLPNKMRVNRERKWFIVIFSYFFFFPFDLHQRAE